MTKSAIGDHLKTALTALVTIVLLFLASSMFGPPSVEAAAFHCDDMECVWPTSSVCWIKYGSFCCPEGGSCESYHCPTAPLGCE
jgi:hypothetical protein